jgi:hypothetical protein
MTLLFPRRGQCQQKPQDESLHNNLRINIYPMKEGTNVTLMAMEKRTQR